MISKSHSNLLASGPRVQPLSVHLFCESRISPVLVLSWGVTFLQTRTPVDVPRGECCQNLTVRSTGTITTLHNLSIYHNHPMMCLPFCLKWKGLPRPSGTTPTSPPGAADYFKAEDDVPLTPTSPKPTIRATPSDSPPQLGPQVEQQLQIPAVPESLPSQVDETLAECPR
jgi:hypothetical protein